MTERCSLRDILAAVEGAMEAMLKELNMPWQKSM